jgi:Ca2+-binding RTX toxin-like protein
MTHDSNTKRATALAGRRQRAGAASLEPLEQRRMFDIIPYITNEEHATNLGYAWVEGSSLSDTIEVSISGDNLRAEVNGSVRLWDLDDMNGIWVVCKGGDDYARIDSAITLPSHIEGDGGDDTLMGGGGDDEIIGNRGDDVIRGMGGADDLYGKDGNDTIRGGNGGDYVEGGDGKDKIYGEAGNDTLHGNSNSDTLYGGSGDDRIYGNDGDDWLYGEDGDDTLEGGSGSDHRHWG